MRGVLPLGTVVLALLAACTPADAPSLSTTTDSAGVAIVVGPSADVPLSWTFEEIARFGGADTGAASFTSASRYNVQTDGSGRIAVLERTDGGWLHLFDSTGTVLWSVGRAGSGPGELQFPQKPAFAQDGSLTLLDVGKMALVSWGADGEFRAESKWVSDAGFPRGGIDIRGDTQLVSIETNDTLHRVVRLEARTPRDTTVVDSMVGPKPQMVMLKCVGLAMAPLFTGELSWSANDAMLATTQQTSYRVDLRVGGHVVRSIRRDVPEVAATVADVERLYPGGMKVRFGGGGECVTPSSEIAEKIGIAPTLPAIRGIALAPDGTLWVERFTFDGETPVTDLFGADGTYLGTLAGTALPIGFLGADRVVMQIKDATDGVSTLGIYRIRRGA
jgi:hypothetical protein